MKSLKTTINTPHALSTEEARIGLETNYESGLSTSEAKKRTELFGENIIRKKKEQSAFLLFLDQLKSPIVYLLLFAVCVSFFFQHWMDGYAILIVILINTAIGFAMEYQAKRSMEALTKLTKVNAKVFRDNALQEILSENIVPGDILFMEAGDLIPADARIFESSQFQADESSLTGESIPVEKAERILEKETSLAERVNMVYKSTFVTKGNAKAVVTHTAMQTEIGKIAEMVQSADKSITPLEKKLEDFGKKLIKVTVVLVVIIFIGGILNGQKIDKMLATAIALAVAAIPEGLPIVATLALAKGMMKMAKYNVIVKKLSSIETLGGTNIICTDKTGTLTFNKIEVNCIYTSDGKTEISAANHKRENPDKNTQQNNSFELVKKIVVLCNTAQLIVKDNEIKEVGDPLETGLLMFAHLQGIDIENFRRQHPKTKEIPFSSETKIMATLHQAEQHYFVAVKGATEELLKKCTLIYQNGEAVTLDETTKAHWIKEADLLSREGLKVIATAFKNNTESISDIPDQLVFVGLVGLLDPPREDVFSAIKECKSAGIRVIMITGDHPATAKNIALKIGLLDSENEEVIHGKNMKDFKDLDTQEKERWANAKIFARVSPKQKLDLIQVLQEKHFVVGMTGDGVNDTPALKKADIGIAMGKRGTQISQDVADMILQDDSFSSIVIAIKQGRVIFDNIQTFVIYLLSSNMSELFIIAITATFNLPFQLAALQILFINLISDVLPALALGVTKGKNSIMMQAPRNMNEPIINKKHWTAIVVYSIVIMLCAVGAVSFATLTFYKTEMSGNLVNNNILFYTLIFSQLLHVFNMSPNRHIPFYKTDVFRNKYVWYAVLISFILSIITYLIEPLRHVLSIHEMTLKCWFIAGGFSFLSLIIIQILKKLKLIY